MDATLSFLKHYWKSITGVVTVIALVFKIDDLAELLRSWVAGGIEPQPPGSGYQLSVAWGWVLALIAIALVASLALALKLTFEVRGLRREELARAERMEKTLRGMMGAANRIANQLYPNESLEVTTGDSGWTGWTYRASNAPAEGFEYQWRLTARRK